jgi:hypothetical protein
LMWWLDWGTPLPSFKVVIRLFLYLIVALAWKNLAPSSLNFTHLIFYYLCFQ